MTIIPTYRRPDYLRVAVNSALEQTFRDQLILVLSDGVAVTADLPEDDRLVTIELSNNFGTPGPVRNVGIRISDSEYVAFLDDDNSWEPHHLTSAVEAFRDGDVMVYAGLRRLLPNGEVWDELTVPFDRRKLAAANFIDASAMVVRRFDGLRFRCVPNKPDKRPEEDWALAMRLSFRGGIRLAPSVTVNYLINDESFYRPRRPQRLSEEGPSDSGDFSDGNIR